MIDINKQYTYNGKPIRIYADGSDTYGNFIHGAILRHGDWDSSIFKESDLVEVWEPKEGELVWTKVTEYKILTVIEVTKQHLEKEWLSQDNCAPFKGELPEAFKGLI